MKLMVNYVQTSTGVLLIFYKNNVRIAEVYDTIYRESPATIPAEFEGFYDWYYEAWGSEFENCTYTNYKPKNWKEVECCDHP